MYGLLVVASAGLMALGCWIPALILFLLALGMVSERLTHRTVSASLGLLRAPARRNGVQRRPRRSKLNGRPPTVQDSPGL